MKPLISVVIPTYNRQDTIEKAILSALKQTYNNIEILICDDGSTDGTDMLVREMCKRDPRVRWLSGVHSGLASVPRNRGIQAAKGEWIAFLDSDDWWLEDKLEKQMRYGDDYAAICSNAARIVKRKNNGNYLERSVPKILDFGRLLDINYVMTSSVLVRRQTVSLAGYFPEEKSLKVGEDYALWLRIATHSPFRYIPEPLFAYRDEPENSLRSGGDGRTVRRAVLKNYIQWAWRHSVSGTMRALLALGRHEVHI